MSKEKRQPVARIEIDGSLVSEFISEPIFLNRDDIQSLKKDIEVYEHENECTKCRGF
jgi:predicted anti-sigma-YlaC factor YlaD